MARPTFPKPDGKRGVDAGSPVQLRLHELRSRIFGNMRMLRVWLPPGYDERETVYPALYLNDGQNLFEPATAFAGVHWRAGETANRLILEKKIRPLIIVGIDNTGKSRAREYIPYKSLDLKVSHPQGKLYPAFLRDEVMPLIERNYRVLKGRENCGLGGSSLGGLITLYTQLAAPRTFARLLIESPSLFVANRRVLKECRKAREWPLRVYLGMGTRETGDALKDEKFTNDARELAGILRKAGLDENRLRVRIQEGGTHSESAWAARFPEALEFLYS